MINLGIIFFALEIVSRYIGFIMGHWGYIALSAAFIIGGIILLVGGYFVEKLRRKLVAQAMEPSRPNKGRLKRQ